MDISDLNLGIELETILKEMAISSPRDVFVFLELYKYYSPEQVAAMLEESENVKVVVPKEINSSAEFTGIENRYNVIVNQVDDAEYVIYYDHFGDDRYAILDMEPMFSNASLAFIAVTPYVFDVLKGNPLPAYVPVQVFKRYLLEALRYKATDIHFDIHHSGNKVSYPVSFRIGGSLKTVDWLIPINKDLNKRIISALIAKKTNANELDLLEVSGVVASSSRMLVEDVELRISASLALDGYHYVTRIQRNETFDMPIEKLGFHTNVQSMLHRITKKRSGITFITGAIRTGKNTTAFAVAHAMLKYAIKIISYESPIEVLMPFTQIDYKESEEMLLHSVRLAKKQDVNVAFINELPNKEVAFAVRDLVNSSIHVITTMHMNRIWHLPYKLKEYYGDEYKDVISQINVVINQKMFPKMCPHCQQKMLVGDIVDKNIVKILEANGIKDVLHSVGCAECNNSGVLEYSNQPYVEFVEFTDELVSELLACDAPAEMEHILREYVKPNSLEWYMSDGVRRGDLSYENLDVLL